MRRISRLFLIILLFFMMSCEKRVDHFVQETQVIEDTQEAEESEENVPETVEVRVGDTIIYQNREYTIDEVTSDRLSGYFFIKVKNTLEDYRWDISTQSVYKGEANTGKWILQETTAYRK